MQKYSFEEERTFAEEVLLSNSLLWRDLGLAYIRDFNVGDVYFRYGIANLRKHTKGLLGLQDCIDPLSSLKDERYDALEESVTRSRLLSRMLEDLRETVRKYHEDKTEIPSSYKKSELQAYMESLWDEIVASNVQSWASYYRQQLYAGYVPDLNLLITPENLFSYHKNIFLEAVQRYLSGDRYLIDSTYDPMSVGQFMFSMSLVFGENNGVGSRQKESIEAYKAGDKKRSADAFYDGFPETIHEYIKERKPVIQVLKENRKIDKKVGRIGPCCLLTAITSHPKFVNYLKL